METIKLRQQSAAAAGKDLVAFNEHLITNAFATMPIIYQKSIDDETMAVLQQRVDGLFPLPYFYARASLVGSGRSKVFTAENLLATTILFRHNMPDTYKQEAILHQLRVNFIRETFDKHENIGRFEIYKAPRSISWLVWVFHKAMVASRGETFLSYASSVLGMAVFTPYGSDVQVRQIRRGGRETYIVGAPVCMEFTAKFGALGEQLPFEVRDAHEALVMVEGFGCPTCKEKGVACESDQHFQTIPLAEITETGAIALFTVDIPKSMDQGNLTGRKEVVANAFN